jgi:hypothetical protein
MDSLVRALQDGRICVVDMSQMRGQQSMIMAGLVLRRIFDRNQQEFTSPNARTIPTIAVIEEAQSVLVEKATASEPFIAWVKEGRKYDLGAMLITQQPGSLPHEILSQGDNWFIFHLLSGGDLTTLKKANAHFSDDLLSSLLNEPIPGHGVFWSSVQGKPYPLSLRAALFEDMYSPADPHHNRGAADTWARGSWPDSGAAHVSETAAQSSVADHEAAQYEAGHTDWDESGTDYLREAEDAAIEAFRSDEQLQSRIRTAEGVPWGELNKFFESRLPDTLDDRSERAFRLVKKAMERVYGDQMTAWQAYRNTNRPVGSRGKHPMYVTAHVGD